MAPISSETQSFSAGADDKLAAANLGVKLPNAPSAGLQVQGPNPQQAFGSRLIGGWRSGWNMTPRRQRPIQFPRLPAKPNPLAQPVQPQPLPATQQGIQLAAQKVASRFPKPSRLSRSELTGFSIQPTKAAVDFVTTVLRSTPAPTDKPRSGKFQVDLKLSSDEGHTLSNWCDTLWENALVGELGGLGLEKSAGRWGELLKATVRKLLGRGKVKPPPLPADPGIVLDSAKTLRPPGVSNADFTPVERLPSLVLSDKPGFKHPGSLRVSPEAAHPHIPATDTTPAREARVAGQFGPQHNEHIIGKANPLGHIYSNQPTKPGWAERAVVHVPPQSGSVAVPSGTVPSVTIKIPPAESPLAKPRAEGSGPTAKPRVSRDVPAEPVRRSRRIDAVPGWPEKAPLAREVSPKPATQTTQAAGGRRTIREWQRELDAAGQVPDPQDAAEAVAKARGRKLWPWVTGAGVGTGTLLLGGPVADKLKTPTAPSVTLAEPPQPAPHPDTSGPAVAEAIERANLLDQPLRELDEQKTENAKLKEKVESLEKTPQWPATWWPWLLGGGLATGWLAKQWLSEREKKKKQDEFGYRFAATKEASGKGQFLSWLARSGRSAARSTLNPRTTPSFTLRPQTPVRQYHYGGGWREFPPAQGSLPPTSTSQPTPNRPIPNRPLNRGIDRASEVMGNVGGGVGVLYRSTPGAVLEGLGHAGASLYGNQLVNQMYEDARPEYQEAWRAKGIRPSSNTEMGLWAGLSGLAGPIGTRILFGALSPRTRAGYKGRLGLAGMGAVGAVGPTLVPPLARYWAMVRNQPGLSLFGGLKPGMGDSPTPPSNPPMPPGAQEGAGPQDASPSDSLPPQPTEADREQAYRDLLDAQRPGGRLEHLNPPIGLPPGEPDTWPPKPEPPPPERAPGPQLSADKIRRLLLNTTRRFDADVAKDPSKNTRQHYDEIMAQERARLEAQP